jgi:AraC-like DNA-binding protein
MESMKSILRIYKQNDKLPIRLISPDFGNVPAETIQRYGNTHRRTHYFFFFMIEGHADHLIDLQPYTVNRNEVLFIVPNQIHTVPQRKQGTDYFKLGFDEDCLSLLPKHYPFLVNPLNNHKIQLDGPSAGRVTFVFNMLRDLLNTMSTDPELILAHLNSLLTEINAGYFTGNKTVADDKLAKYINFKLFVEENFTKHPSITDIAQRISVNTNTLYNIVKNYSGLSPKEFLNNRLVLEAKRRLFYSESSVKELAYDLGFTDPEYFSRLFKKVTGKTVGAFSQDLLRM